MNRHDPIAIVKSGADQPPRHRHGRSRRDRALLDLIKVARRDSVEQRRRLFDEVFPEVIRDARLFVQASFEVFWRPTPAQRVEVAAIRRRYGLMHRSSPASNSRPSLLTDAFREAYQLAQDELVG